MSNAVGKDGAVTFLSGHQFGIISYSFTKGQRLINNTVFGATNEAFDGGLGYGRFTIVGVPTYGSAGDGLGLDSFDDTPGSVVFQVATGCTETTNVLVGDGTVDSDVNGEARSTFTGVTSGNTVEAWDDGTS